MSQSSHAAQRPYPYRQLSWVAMLASFVIAGCTLVVDAHADRAEAQSADQEFHRAAQVFTEIFHEIQEKYAEEITTTDLMEAAIHGMFESLDPHSQYMGPDHFDQLTTSTQGEFFGIGIHITMRDGVLTVIAPIPNTPAAKLGLQPWDRIVEISDDESGEMVSTEGMSLTEAVSKIKGPRGTQVTLRIYRAPADGEGEGEFLDFTITRDEIEILSVFHTMVDGTIGHIRIAQFSEATGDDVREAIRDLHSQGAEAIVLDLRWNSGGLLSQAIEVADCFLDKGDLIVSTRGRISSQNRQYQSDNDALTDLPMICLINNGSASASEIVAGALQDHHRAVILAPEGQNSFGKASVQTIEELRSTLDYGDDPRPTAIRLTTAHYFTPDNRAIHGEGIEPDIGVELPTGHERELFAHGLLGDPTTVEDENHRTAVRDNIDEVFNGDNGDSTDNSEVESDESDEPQEDSVTEVDFDAENDEEGDEEFSDILLDAAIDYLRVFFIMNRDAA